MISPTMISFSSETLFELIGQICEISSSPAEKWDDIFIKPVIALYDTISKNEKYRDIQRTLSLKFPICRKLTENINEATDSKAVELYIEWIVFLLHLYSQCLMEAFDRGDAKQKIGPEVLTPNQMKLLRSSLDKVFLLGISLQLHPGVGLPLHKKCSSDPLIKFLCPQATDHNKNIDFLKRVVLMMMELFDMKESDVFRSYITSYHFNAYLAALLQLSYSPDVNDSDQFKNYLLNLMLRLPEKFIIKEVFLLMAKQPIESSRGGKVDNPPMWLVFRGCLFLKKCITKEGGVKNTILSLIDDLSDSNMHDQAYFESVASLISNFPLRKVNSNDYDINIVGQVLDMLSRDDLMEPKDVRQRVMTILVYILDKVSSSQPSLFEEKFLEVFLEPIIACSNHGKYSATEGEVVPEKRMSVCIERIHELLVNFHFPSSSLPLHFLPFIPVLFQIFMFVSSSNLSHLKTPIFSILINILKNVETWKAVSMLKFLLDLRQTPPTLNPGGLYFISGQVKFVNGPSGGMQAIAKKTSVTDIQKTSRLKESQERASCLVRLVSSLDDQVIATSIFKATLEDFAEMSCVEVEEDQDLWHKVVISGERGDDDSSWLRNISLLTFLSEFMEMFCDVCSLDAEDIFPVCRVIVERSVGLLEVGDENSVENSKLETQNEILSFAVGLLTVIIIESKQMTPEKWKQAEPFIPLLRYLSSHHLSQETRVISYELMEVIATHGKISDSVQYDTDIPKRFGRSTEEATASKTSVKDSMRGRDFRNEGSAFFEGVIENEFLHRRGNLPNEEVVLPASDLRVDIDGNLKPKLTKSRNNKKSKLIEEIVPAKESSYYDDSNKILELGNVGAEFCEMLTNVTNFIEPIKGAGLIKMRKLIESKDNNVETHKSLLLKICRSCLCHEDSYVFLSAVEALCSLASRHPDLVLPNLMEDYRKDFEQNRVEVKLKLGEALVKVIRMLGVSAAKYKDGLLSTLLFVLREDDDDTVRSSSISNLAEVCKILRYSLSTCLYEIFDVVQQVLKYDKSVEVRRAAALLTTQILRGTSKETFTILGDFLPEFYRLLKYTYKTDCDHVVQHHIQLSLEELNEIMKSFLFPQPTFEKNIFVLNPLP